MSSNRDLARQTACWPVGVCYEDMNCYTQAVGIADRLSLPLFTDVCGENIIVCSPQGVFFQTVFGTIMVDFNSPGWHYRLARAGQERLVKAMGRKGDRTRKKVFDFTCGLCRDSFILASVGFNLVSFENNSVLATLVKDGLKRACLADKVCSVAERITFVAGDALQHMGDHSIPDIIYIDPMFTVTGKKAKVKKELQVIRGLQQGVPKEEKLLEAARLLARERVVVKRAVSDTFIGEYKPSYSVAGKTVRFDVYLG